MKACVFVLAGAAMLAGLLAGPRGAFAGAPSVGFDVWQACDVAAAEAERDAGLPPGLLAAIGRVESGRWNRMTGLTSPWPYAIDVGGYDLFLDDSAAAAARVRALREDGFASIDVGCFQINLLAHPDAFATLAEGFDPSTNAAYAARFLNALHVRTGTWDAAVAAYHSATPGLGEPYRARVYAAWANRGDAVQGVAAPVTGIWTVTTAGRPSASLSIRVIVPTVFAAALDLPSPPAAPAKPGRSGRTSGFLLQARASLPRVFTPSRL